MLLGKFFYPSMVALYNSAKMPFRLYSLLTQSLNLLILPGTSHLAVQDRISDIKTLFEKVIAYYWGVMLILNLALIILADKLFFLLYSGRYPDAVPIFRIFLIFTFFEPVYNISMNIYYGMGKPEKAFKPLLLAVPLFLTICLILIPIYAGYGAVLGFGMANLTMALLLLWSLHRDIAVSLSEIGYHFSRIPGRIGLMLKRHQS
jgi:O-antigen/teichoic acid export membrane protein